MEEKNSESDDTYHVRGTRVQQYVIYIYIIYFDLILCDTCFNKTEIISLHCVDVLCT